MINATGLWLHEKQDGTTYMSGTLGGVRVLIFKNEHKTEDKHPDYRLVFAENKPKEGTQKGDISKKKTGGVPF